MLEPIKKRRLYEEIIIQIQSMIAKENFQPGQRLPSERELAAVMGVARSSVREALRSMELLGYLESRHGEGTFVKDRYAFDDLFEVRELLECEIAGLAAIRASKEDIEQMEDAIQKSIDIVRQGQIPLEQDQRFHDLLVKATGNDMLSQIMNVVADFANKGRQSSLLQPGRSQASIEEHCEIVEAIKDRDDVRAREAMRNHLKMVKKQVIVD